MKKASAILEEIRENPGRETFREFRILQVFFIVVNRDAVWVIHASNGPPRLLSLIGLYWQAA